MHFVIQGKLMQVAKSISERSVCVVSESPDRRAGIPRRRSLSCHPTPRSGHGDARDRNRLVPVVADFARRLAAFPGIACVAALTLGALAPMPVAAQTMDVTTVPGVPTALEATVSGKTRIRLSWTAPANTGGADTAIDGYRIEYSAPDYLFPQSTNVWAELEADTGSASTTYDHDHGLAPGVRLEYRVSAINDVGIGGPSNVVETATQAAPDTAGDGAPDSTGITVNGRRIVIAFDEVLDADAVPNRTQFQIGINGDRPVRPERAEVTGATVVLALDAGDAVDADDSVGVRYTWPRVVIADAEVPQAMDALQDVEGNLVERWNRRTAVNETTDSGVKVEPATVSVEEGGSDTYEVVLKSRPAAEVTIDIRAGGDVTASPASLTFGRSDWDTVRTVTVSAAQDGDGDDDSVTLVHDMKSNDPNYDATAAASVTVTVEDRYAVTVGSKPSLSAADAEATEGEATMDFAVALDVPATTRVAVDYATADGSATAGEDYVGKAGTLTFAAGEMRKTVRVSLLDDAKNEGEETFTLTFSNPSGVRIEDGEATGTIVNDDSLQKAWLARFGRTVGAQVVEAVSARLEGSARSQVTMGGRRLGTSQSVASPETVLEHREDRADRAGNAWDRDRESARAMGGRDLLSASSFQLASRGEADGPSFAAWGRVAGGGFEADVDDVRMDGDVMTGIVGADVAKNHWLAGAAVSFSTGEGGYRLTGDVESTFDRGTIESTLTSVYPYARLRLSEGVSVWGLAGYGTGDLTLTERSEEKTNRFSTDTTMRLGALGVRRTLVPAGETGDLELAAKSDVFWMRMTSDAVEGAREAEAEADASRLRFVLEASRSFVTSDGATLTPNLELGLRHDGGDAENGTGMEAGVGIGYAGAGVSIEGSVRALVAHEASGYEEWGASGSVRVEPGAAGRGLSLTVAPSWGNASSAQERLWSAGDAGRLSPGRDFEPESRLAAELGYGLAAPRRSGLVTPFAGLAWGYGGRRTWRIGTRWEIAPRASLSLEASRSQPSGDGDPGPVNAVALRTKMRW